MGQSCPVFGQLWDTPALFVTLLGQSCRVMDSCRTVLPCNGTVVGQSCSVMGQQWDGPALSWTAVGQGVDERMINVHYYYLFLFYFLLCERIRSGIVLSCTVTAVGQSRSAWDSNGTVPPCLWTTVGQSALSWDSSETVRSVMG